LRTVRQQTVDDQTGPRLAGEARAAALAAAMAISGSQSRDLGERPTRSVQQVAGEGSSGIQTAVSGPGSRDIFGRPTRGPVSRSAPASPINGNVIPPPPNATVVVCVLAGTGRADLWVRNNRGQTPLDLCSADQPLRQALIKCCVAAAHARVAQETNVTTATVEEAHSSRAPTINEESPQRSQLTLNNMPPDYSIKAPYHDAYAPMMSREPDAPKNCTKTFATRSNAEFLQLSPTFTNQFLRIGIPPPLPGMMMLGDRTPAVLLDDVPSTSRAAMPQGDITEERVDNNLTRETDNHVDNNDPEPNFMDDDSILSITNDNGSIVIESYNNR